MRRFGWLGRSHEKEMKMYVMSHEKDRMAKRWSHEKDKTIDVVRHKDRMVS
jgi:hypothetical protein